MNVPSYNRSLIPSDDDYAIEDCAHDEDSTDNSYVDKDTTYDHVSEHVNNTDIDDDASYEDASENEHDSNQDDTDSIRDDGTFPRYGNDDNEKHKGHSNETDEDETEYDESFFKSENCSYVEILPLKYETLKNEIPDLKDRRTIKDHGNAVNLENIYTKENQNCKNCLKNGGKPHDFEWLGNMVTSQLDDISPSFRSEFAWDVQCLVRKYILKSKVKCKNADISRTSDNNSPDREENLILPRSTSLNISFL